MGISVVVPVYNEEANVERAVREITSQLRKPYEIIIVNDGSLDKSLEIASQLDVKVISYEQNKGKGHALRKGLLRSRYETVFFMDCDLAVSPQYIHSFLDRNEDVVIASRRLGQSKVMGRSLVRRFMSKSFHALVGLMFGLEQKDVMCGFKMFQRSVILDLIPKMNVDNIAFDLELLLLTKQHKYSVAEIPVSWRAGQKTSFTLGTESLKVLGSVLSLTIKFIFFFPPDSGSASLESGHITK